MKTKNKFFHRKLEPALEGLDKRLSNLSVITIILGGLIYIINSAYIMTEYLRHDWYFRNLGGALIFGIFILTVGVGFVVNRPPKQQIFLALFIFVILMILPFYQFQYI